MQYHSRRNTPHKISLTAMFAAFSLICLYLAAILPVGRLVLYFASGLFVCGVLGEEMPGAAALLFLAVGGLGCILAPIPTVLPYILLFGHWGIGKYFIEKLKDKVVVFIVKLLYWNICMAAIYFLAFDVMIQGTLKDAALWLLIVLAEVAFFIFDFVFTQLTQFYLRAIRPKLLRH